VSICRHWHDYSIRNFMVSAVEKRGSLSTDYIAIVTDRRAVFRKTGITSPVKEARLRLQRESEDNERNGGRARDNANARKRRNESLTNRDLIRRVGAILRIHLLRRSSTHSSFHWHSHS